MRIARPLALPNHPQEAIAGANSMPFILAVALLEEKLWSSSLPMKD